MSNQKPLNVGLVGYGFMGRTHSNAYGKVNQFFDLDRRPVLKAVCGRNESNVKAFAERWGYQSTETDWHELLSRSDIDLVDIATPNDSHADIAIAAAEAGKMVMCENRSAAIRPKPAAHGGGGRKRRNAQYGLVQLPPGAGGYARKTDHR
jgi:predicted dinucleotide-utilizing enzyme